MVIDSYTFFWIVDVYYDTDDNREEQEKTNTKVRREKKTRFSREKKTCFSRENKFDNLLIIVYSFSITV